MTDFLKPGTVLGIYRGEIFPVVVSVKNGTGQIVGPETEPVRTALSYLRSSVGHPIFSGSAVLPDLVVPEDFFKKNDITIDFVPKGDSSAGLAIAVALVSACFGIPVESHMAITGEISLDGMVLSVGNIKEELLAANAAGIDSVILPAASRECVENLTSEERGTVSIHYVTTIKEAVFRALVAARWAKSWEEFGCPGWEVLAGNKSSRTA
jgi:ATP-dependent Lon protease